MVVRRLAMGFLIMMGPEAVDHGARLDHGVLDHRALDHLVFDHHWVLGPKAPSHRVLVHGMSPQRVQSSPWGS